MEKNKDIIGYLALLIGILVFFSSLYIIQTGMASYLSYFNVIIGVINIILGMFLIWKK